MMLHDYQKRAVNFQCSLPTSMVWMCPGLGKTAITLTSIVHLLNTGFLSGVLIVAPIRVLRLVWRQEAAKWDHTKHLTFAMMVGDRDQRTRALMSKANVYLINYENLKWLSETLQHYYIAKHRPLPFSGLVWDEISKCKNSTTHRVTAVKKILPYFNWITGLTGTPASNGYKDLHGQYLVVDRGERLGESKTKFTQYYYHKEGEHKLIPYANAEDEIKQRISDITLEMSAADYNPLPDMIVNDIETELPEDLRAKYDAMEHEMFLQFDALPDKELFNQAALMNTCLQFSAGHVYPIAGNPLFSIVHGIKLDALEDLVDELAGEPLLLSYQFRSDAERIMERFKDLDPVNLTECKSERALRDAMTRWRRGDLLLLIGHPMSMGHGIDGLQDAGHTLAWFGLTWSLDLYLQFNGRVRRQGQGVPVMCHRFVMRDTVDCLQRTALETKATTEQSLRSAVKAYREQRGL
jgi:SNF2 family DNA or RNA helicase